MPYVQLPDRPRGLIAGTTAEDVKRLRQRAAVTGRSRAVGMVVRKLFCGQSARTTGSPRKNLAAAQKEPAQQIGPVYQGRGGLIIRRVFS